MAHILALGGDGIGPEILDQGVRVAEHLAAAANLSLNINYELLHGASYDRYGSFCTADLLGMVRAMTVMAVFVQLICLPRPVLQMQFW